MNAWSLNYAVVLSYSFQHPLQHEKAQISLHKHSFYKQKLVFGYTLKDLFNCGYLLYLAMQ